MLVLASGAFSQEEKPCAGDVAKFCGDVKPGEGRIAKCLKQHKDELSPACKMHLAQVKEAIKETHKACEDDITMFCPGVQPGEGRILNCLKEHKSELSSKCKEHIIKAKEKMK
jgi:hypothetical protein